MRLTAVGVGGGGASADAASPYQYASRTHLFPTTFKDAALRPARVTAENVTLVSTVLDGRATHATVAVRANETAAFVTLELDSTLLAGGRFSDNALFVLPHEPQVRPVPPTPLQRATSRAQWKVGIRICALSPHLSTTWCVDGPLLSSFGQIVTYYAADGTRFSKEELTAALSVRSLVDTYV